MHPTLLTLTLLGTVFFSLTSLAQPAADNQPWRRLAEEGRSLKEQSSTMSAAADARLAEDKVECHKKFLASSCLEDAMARYRKAMAEARGVGIEGRRIEREARDQEKAEKAKKRAEEAPQLEAERLTKLEENRQKKLQKEEKRQTKLREDAERVEKLRQKNQEKLAEQARRGSGQPAPKATKSDSAREQEYEERAARIDARKQAYADKLKQREAAKAQKEAEWEAAVKAEEAKKNRFLCWWSSC